MQSNIVRSEVVESEVVGADFNVPVAAAGATITRTAEYIQVMATIQIVVPAEREVSLMILDKLQKMENQLSVCTNNIDYLESKLSHLQKQKKETVKLMEVLHDTNERLKAKDTVLANLPQWHSVGAVAEVKGLSADAVRKQLQNGDFEDGVDFKYKGSRIEINQGAVERIQRKRRSSHA